MFIYSFINKIFAKIIILLESYIFPPLFLFTLHSLLCLLFSAILSSSLPWHFLCKIKTQLLNSTKPTFHNRESKIVN